jgi:hypothetical protein
MIKADRIFLDLSNPRHKKFDNQDQAIEYLCANEQTLELAQDIAENGLNPLELFALLKEGKNTFTVAEGNRRACALMLLRDPELSPAKYRKRFKALSEKWSPVKELFSIVFKSRDEVNLWLDRIHAGVNDGKGRRPWNSEQKARNSGYSKNTLAQSLLDLGEAKGLITESDRKGRLSTVEAFSRNPIIKDALGITNTDPMKISTTLPDSDFDLVLKKFMNDVASKEITTRKSRDKDGFSNYANDLRNVDGLSGTRVRQHDVDIPGKRSKPAKRAKKPLKPTKIVPVDEISDSLAAIPNYKLEKIYYSLVSLTTKDHTPLLTVGAWSFLETLTAATGRNPQTDFYSYLTKNKLDSLGVGQNQKTIRPIIKKLSEVGNITKHDVTSAAFNDEQLINDFETLKDVIIALAKEAKSKP